MEIKQLLEVGMPLVNYLRDHYNENTTAIVTQNSVELMEGAVSISFGDTEKSVDDDGKVELSTLAPGAVFKIAEHDFIVLEQMDGQTAVISKDLMKENVRFGNNRNYLESGLRRVMEEEIQPIIEAAVGADNLVEHEVELISVDMQNEFGTLVSKVRPISFEDARKHNDLLVNKNLPDWYWTLTPWSTAERGWDRSVAVVSPRGIIGRDYCVNFCGVRPFCILKSNIFVSKGEQ